MFDGPEGDALWNEVCSGIKEAGRNCRYALEKCARTRSKKGFDKIRNRILKKHESMSIYLFFKNHWVTWDAISKTDKAKISTWAKKVQKELVDTYLANDEYYD
jgi:hypothetical protein